MEVAAITVFFVSAILSAGFGWLAMAELSKLLNHVKAGWFIRTFAPMFVMFRASRDESEKKMKFSIWKSAIISTVFVMVAQAAFIYLFELHGGFQKLVEK